MAAGERVSCMGFDAARHSCPSPQTDRDCANAARGSIRIRSAATSATRSGVESTAPYLMKPPTIYAEWLSVVTIYLKAIAMKKTIAAMEAGKLEWTSGVAERITRRIHEIFDSRLKLLGEHFRRDTNYSHGHETLLSNALLGIRKKLILLTRLVALPALPDIVSKV